MQRKLTFTFLATSIIFHGESSFHFKIHITINFKKSAENLKQKPWLDFVDTYIYFYTKYLQDISVKYLIHANFRKMYVKIMEFVPKLNPTRPIVNVKKAFMEEIVSSLVLVRVPHVSMPWAVKMSGMTIIVDVRKGFMGDSVPSHHSLLRVQKALLTISVKPLLRESVKTEPRALVLEKVSMPVPVTLNTLGRIVHKSYGSY